MEALFDFISSNAAHAHWIFFGLLILAGLNVPISEDLMLLGGGALTSTLLPDHVLKMYLWIFLGCYVSAWEAYWIGRLLGPKLFQIRFFKHIITAERVEKLRAYLQRFGIYTFILGRFCPGGVRNALFMSSGLTKMPFLSFIGRDLVACLLSSTVLFYLGFQFGEHLDTIIFYVSKYNKVFLLAIGCLLMAIVFYLSIKKPVQEA